MSPRATRIFLAAIVAITLGAAPRALPAQHAPPMSPTSRTSARAVLPTVAVVGATPCETRPDSAARVVALWEAARDAFASVARANAERRPFELRVVERLVRADGPLGDARRTRLRADRARPWDAADVARLDTAGWVRADGDSTVYHAPDGDALLSEAFLTSHCFGLARREGRGGVETGLTFAPPPDRVRPDVAGAIWLDSATAALRTVEFTYVRVADSLSTGEPPGGTLAFARLPDGAWYLRAWTLRLPDAARAAADPPRRRPRDPGRWRYVPYRERGGEAVPLGAPAASDGRTATVTGTATDGVTGEPLAGAVVMIPGEPAARADAAGRFAVEVRGVPDADTDYRVAVAHPRLTALGVPEPEGTVTLRAGRGATIHLAGPSRAALLRRTCGSDTVATIAGRRTALGLAVGRLRATDGAALPAGVHLHAEWIEPPSLDGRAGRGAPPPVPQVAVDPDGRFAVCPLPAGRDVLLRASAGGADGPTVRFRLPASGVAVQDVPVPGRGGSAAPPR